jgi:uncharacterized protein (TIGR03083 family)
MEPSEMYEACRSRLLELAPTLTSEQLAAPLAATPPWTVLDGYRHLTGVCVDVLDGAMDGAGSPEWTAAQLASRADRSIDDVCTEWARRGPELDDRVAEVGVAMAFVAFDAWTHEQDIRAAVGLKGVRGGDVVVALAGVALATFGARYGASGAPAVRIVMDGDERALGEGEPVATLETTPYELLRIIFGRRSEAQVAAASWSGDSGGVIPALHIFPFPDRDIED